MFFFIKISLAVSEIRRFFSSVQFGCVWSFVVSLCLMRMKDQQTNIWRSWVNCSIRPRSLKQNKDESSKKKPVKESDVEWRKAIKPHHKNSRYTKSVLRLFHTECNRKDNSKLRQYHCEGMKRGRKFILCDQQSKLVAVRQSSYREKALITQWKQARASLKWYSVPNKKDTVKTGSMVGSEPFSKDKLTAWQWLLLLIGLVE